MDVLTALENSGFGTWVRESGSLWSYPIILFTHTIGLAILVGPNLAIDLCVLGVARGMPLAPLKRMYRVMWIGFWFNVTSGAALLIADATTKLINPVFYIKLALIVGGVTTMVMIKRRAFGEGSGEAAGSLSSVKALAWISVLCWLGAVTAGRLMAYLGPVSGAPDLNNTF